MSVEWVHKVPIQEAGTVEVQVTLLVVILVTAPTEAGVLLTYESTDKL
jgi:hypothetical protein